MRAIAPTKCAGWVMGRTLTELQEIVKNNHTVSTALNSGTVLLSVIVMTLPEMCCSDTCKEEW